MTAFIVDRLGSEMTAGESNFGSSPISAVRLPGACGMAFVAEKSRNRAQRREDCLFNSLAGATVSGHVADSQAESSPGFASEL
jgi:hypothetical protein